MLPVSSDAKPFQSRSFPRDAAHRDLNGLIRWEAEPVLSSLRDSQRWQVHVTVLVLVCLDMSTRVRFFSTLPIPFTKKLLFFLSGMFVSRYIPVLRMWSKWLQHPDMLPHPTSTQDRSQHVGTCGYGDMGPWAPSPLPHMPWDSIRITKIKIQQHSVCSG